MQKGPAVATLPSLWATTAGPIAMEDPRGAIDPVPRSEREVESLGDQPPEPPAERMRTAIDLGEPALAGEEGKVSVLDRDDHLVHGVQGLHLAGLVVLLGRDLAPGGIREFGRDLLAVPLG